MTSIRFDHVELSDGRKTVYQDLSFELTAGQIGAVFGPSRTGKSSLLLLAAGHLPPTRGRVLIDGKPADGKRVGLGPIHDLTPLFDTLTVEEQLLFQARLHGVRGAKARTAELLQTYGLQEVRKSRIKDVGHLEQFHVGLASALVHRPKVVLIDEPERGLTNEEWEVAYADLKSLADEGCTVLLTTVLAMVADRCDFVLDLTRSEVHAR
ncbi:MAG: ATP-binding cassette domain-containing protein [Tumebacillaceae bacterium]